MLKNLLTIGAFLLLLTGLAGCGNSESEVSQFPEKKETKVEAQADTQDNQTTTEEETPTEESDSSSSNGVFVIGGGSKESISDKILTKTFERLTYDISDKYRPLAGLNTGGIPAVAYIIDSADRTSFNIIAEKLSSVVTVDQYVKAAKAQTGFNYESERNYNQGGQSWNEQISTNPKSGLKMFQQTVIYEGVAYVFTYGAYPDKFDQHLGEFEEIMKTVKFNYQ